MAKTAKRKYSRPALKKVVVVNSEASIDAMGAYVNQTMSAIYSLDVILFYIGSEQVAEEANSKINELFEQKLAVFDKEISKLQGLVDEHDIEEIEYTEQRTKEYKVYSPLCATYIRLFKKFELNTNLIDRLWLNGELSSSQRNGKVLKLGRHMRNVSRQVINMSKVAMKLAQNEGKEAEVNESLKEIDDVAKVTKAEASNEAEKQAVA
ncbi:hypothetical protein JCM19236_6340 [Vibrio sp. JCM 19236]|nr:hypothetical protein JCM19236_6340 [Vibrio sp. JCM 19236]